MIESQNQRNDLLTSKIKQEHEIYKNLGTNNSKENIKHIET